MDADSTINERIDHVTKLSIQLAIQSKLENVAIVNALQLKADRRRAVPIRFNFVVRVKFELAQLISCCLRAYLLFIVRLRCDLEL